MPRVLHVSASFPRHEADHVAPFFLDLVAAQRDAGWDLAVVAAHDAGLPRRHQVAGVSVRRVRYGPDRGEVLVYRGGGHARLRSPWHVLLLPGLLLGLLAGVLRTLRRWRPDVVVGHWLAPAGLLLAVLPTRVRRVLTVHGNDVVLAERLPRLARLVARRVDAVVAVSDDLARRAERALDLPAGAVAVARFPLPPGLAPAPLPAAEPPRLLAAGRAAPEKGLDVLLRALARPEAADWHATIVTDGPERPRLERLAADLGDRVRLVPPVSRRELHELIGSHHAVVVPSRSEGLGLFAVEAVALGRRVVASAVGGLPEAVEDGVDGALVPPDDPEALAAALARLPVVTPPAGRSAERHRPETVIAALTPVYFPDADRTAAW